MFFLRAEKNGKKRGRQSLKCLNCHKQFFARTQKQQPIWIGQAYRDYSFGKQSLKQLGQKYGLSIPTLRHYFDNYLPYTGEVIPVPEHPVAVVFDVTFFDRTNGILVFRAEGKTLYWQEVHHESRTTIAHALDTLDVILEKKYASFTIDGKPGIQQLLQERYPRIPVQFCQFHQKQIVTRYITNNPKTSCGRAIQQLMMTLTKTTQERFHRQMRTIEEQFVEYLKERNERRQYCMTAGCFGLLRTVVRNKVLRL